MNQNDLLNKETRKAISDCNGKVNILRIIIGVLILCNLITGLALIDTDTKNNLYKGKAKNDSLVIKRLNDNLLEPR